MHRYMVPINGPIYVTVDSQYIKTDSLLRLCLCAVATSILLYLMRRAFLVFTGCRKVLEHIFILPFQETGNILNFCEVGLKISGVAPISSQAAIHFPNTSLASVSMASTERHTVAFLGTSDGKLKKVIYCIQLSNTFQRALTETAL